MDQQYLDHALKMAYGSIGEQKLEIQTKEKGRFDLIIRWSGEEAGPVHQVFSALVGEGDLVLVPEGSGTRYRIAEHRSLLEWFERMKELGHMPLLHFLICEDTSNSDAVTEVTGEIRKVFAEYLVTKANIVLNNVHVFIMSQEEAAARVNPKPLSPAESEKMFDELMESFQDFGRKQLPWHQRLLLSFRIWRFKRSMRK